MLKSKVNQLLAATGLIMAAMGTSAYAHADHSGHSHTTVGIVAVHTHRHVATADDHKGVAFLKDKLNRKAREENLKSNTSPARSPSMQDLKLTVGVMRRAVA